MGGLVFILCVINTFNIYIIIVLPSKKIYINEPENELREYMSTYIQHSSFHRHSFFDRSCAYYPIPLHFVELIRFLLPGLNPSSTLRETNFVLSVP